jgi:OOP family OmpA-OmpF porin
MRLASIALELAVAALLAGCVTGKKIRADGEVIASDIARARKSGAYRCAPRELAMAEAHLDFAHGEVAEGNSARAQEHIAVASENVRQALVLSKDCGPKQVVIKDKKEPVIVKIEPADRDGDGVVDADDECPDVPGPAENKGCPLAVDSDGDGIPDNLDRCPLNPEDKDGFQDEDGCPDPDNDNDGITDAMDACPNDPGTVENRGCPILDRDRDGIADAEDACPDEPGIPDPDPKRNGCPRKLSLVVVKKDRIEIKQQINFEFAKSTIKGARSFQILDQVTQVLKDYPSIKRVRIEGHTDSVGSKPTNLQLSQARAESVMRYLVAKGIEASRMEAEGFGMDRPIASNATERGRAQNRRTEFNIVERD